MAAPTRLPKAIPAAAGEGSAPGATPAPAADGFAPLRSPGRVSAGMAARPRRAARSPQNVQRLGRLRAELRRIARHPCDPARARLEILQALARSGLGDWTVPRLDDEKATHRYADGSLCVRLLAHSIIFNPWGAFRIVDRHAPAPPYFELPGCKERPFVLPQELAGP